MSSKKKEFLTKECVIVLIAMEGLAIFRNFRNLFSIVNISPTTHAREMTYSSFKGSNIGLSLWSREPLSARALLFTVFWRPFYDSEACSINSIPSGSTAQGLIVEGYLVNFLHEPMSFEKNGFCQKGNFGNV